MKYFKKISVYGNWEMELEKCFYVFQFLIDS